MREKEIYGLNLLQIICIDLFCFHSAEANGNHLSPDLFQLIWKKKSVPFIRPTEGGTSVLMSIITKIQSICSEYWAILLRDLNKLNININIYIILSNPI